MEQHEKNRQNFFFFLGGGGGGRRGVRRIYIYEKLCLDSPRVANLGRCHDIFGGVATCY